MNLLSRRRTMGNKESEYQLVEVENIPKSTAQVLDDARESGFLLESPYHLRLSSIARYMYIHLLTDADFVCMDVSDNAIAIDRNLYIPAIGKYGIGNVASPANVDAAGSIGNNAVAYTYYPRYYIYDSLGRKWVKVEINGTTVYDSGQETHKRIIYNFSENLPIYYCAENDLGKVFPERRWDKHYTVYPNVKTILNADNKWSNEGGINYYNGLKASDSYSSVISETHFDSPIEANLNGVLQGYLIEVSDSTDQVIINYADVVGFMGLLRSQNDRPALYQETRITGEVTVTNTAELKWITLAVNTTTMPRISVVLVSEW